MASIFLVKYKMKHVHGAGSWPRYFLAFALFSFGCSRLSVPQTDLVSETFFNMLCLLPGIPEPNLPLPQKGLLVRKVSFSFLLGI